MKAVLGAAGVQAVETRPDNGDVSLGERCRISNKAAPNLFVSLHSNATDTLATGPDGWGNTRGREAYVYGLSGERYKAARAIFAQAEGVAWVKNAACRQRLAEAGLAVAWITESGIMLGDESRDLMLDEPVTRRQYAVMEYRKAKLEGKVKRKGSLEFQSSFYI